jgi:hypothetical protein
LIKGIEMINLNTRLSTDGSGYWSNVAKTVLVTGLELSSTDDEGQFGELRVHFSPSTWDINKDGLIYTDNQFISDLKVLLSRIELDTDVSYSEQGMQGDTFVSLDVGPEFIKSYKMA